MFTEKEPLIFSQKLDTVYLMRMSATRDISTEPGTDVDKLTTNSVVNYFLVYTLTANSQRINSALALKATHQSHN